MEPWQKLIQVLVEIWVEEDIRSGKITAPKPEESPSIEVPNEDERKEKAA